MRKRIWCGLLVALLVWTVAGPAALASEEVSLPEEVWTEDEVLSSPEDGAGDTEETEALPEETPVPSSETEEPPAAEELPLPEADELPLSDDAALPEGDPEDPLYWKYAVRTQVDGASYGSTWSAFQPRALKDGETLRRGIDVSAWQGTVNWTKVAAAGVEFVFIRGAYRGTGTGKINTDGRFVDYIRGAKAAGLQVGVYIFSQAITVAEAEEEAQYLLDLLKGYSIDLPLVFDLEHYTGGRFTRAKLSRRAVTDMCLAFCRKVEAAGYESMVYSNPSMLNNDMYPAELSRLWLANFTTRTSYTGHEYEYWQCSDIGSVSGISGYVDLDFWFEPSTGPFNDVKPGGWYYDTVMRAYESGIVNGVDTAAKRFDPGGTATRGQVITMIYRMEGSPAWSGMTAFTDLTQDYYKDAVYWAAEKGVSTGYGGAEFRPGRAITREELVTLLYRMSGEPETAGSLDAYSDASSVQSYAKNAMAWAVSRKIVTGYENGTLRPRANATRAEVCTILMRYAALEEA